MSVENLEWRSDYMAKRAIHAPGWNWKRVFRRWQKRFAEGGLSVSELFLPLTVYDPTYSKGRPSGIAWCRVDEVPALHLRLQEHFDRYPGTNGPLHSEHLRWDRSGAARTIEFLWEEKNSAESTAALLLASSLFERLSPRSRACRLRPPLIAAAEFVQGLAHETWLGDPFATAWHWSCTDVLPYGRWRHERPSRFPATVGEMIDQLADEHISVFREIRPVEAVFSEGPDPEVAATIAKTQADERARQRAWSQAMAQEEAARSAEEGRRDREHPRWREWGALEAEELRTLIWSAPSTRVARDFGVSDVAVAKRCKRLGLTKPPRGFWAKVESGEIPHPCGNPPPTKGRKRRDPSNP